MVSPDGRVKVLDFGLAKLREAELDADGVTRVPTGELTGEGRIIGTVSYMSPEQAEGKPIDSRSDLFSLGVMLHEMATGDRPFKGDTNVSIISSILKDTPTSVSDLNPKMPVELGRIVRRALAKDPSRRYQTAIDLRNELEELKQETTSGVTTTVGTSAAARRFPMAALISGAALLALLAAALLYQFGVAGRRPAQFEVNRLTRLTSTGNALIAAVSGDGRYAVHIKLDRAQPSLWVRQTATLSDVQIVPGAPVRYKDVSFSPDGNFVYYLTYELAGGVGTLYKVPVLGGTPQRILEDVDSRISFSPDRQHFAFMRGKPGEGRNFLMIANADGTGARDVASTSLPDQFLLNTTSWSPDGKTVLVVAQSLRDGPHLTCFAVDVASGRVRDACGRWGLVNEAQWLPDGRSIVITGRGLAEQESQLWQISYPAGERRRITNDLNNYIGISLTTDGRTIATVQAENVGNLWVGTATDPMSATQLSGARGRADGLSGLAWTPDNRLVFSSSASGTVQLWISDADGQNAHQLTTDKDVAVFPSVSPDGRFIVFQQASEAGMFISRVDVDGSSRRRVTSEGAEFFPILSPDGRTLFYMSPKGGQLRPFKMPLDGGPAVSLAETLFRATDVSPDGRQLLGNGWDAANRRSSLATLSVDGGTPQLLNTNVLGQSAWTRDGAGITYGDIVGGRLNLLVRDLASGKMRQLTSFTADNVMAFAWSRDGSRLAMLRGTLSSDVVMITAK